MLGWKAMGDLRPHGFFIFKAIGVTLWLFYFMETWSFLKNAFKSLHPPPLLKGGVEIIMDFFNNSFTAKEI